MVESTQSKYLQFLPAIFQRKPPPTAPEREPFLGPFLLPFEKTIGSFEDVLAVVDRFFSPAFAPAQDFLPWLATWIALVLDEEWDEDRRRRLLAEAMELYRWRGTITGLKRYMDLCAGLDPEDVDIKESRSPAGMQIGVSSRIGGVVRSNTPDTGSLQRGKIVAESHDYYLVDSTVPAAPPPDPDPATPAAMAGADRVRFVYPGDWVQRIKLEEDGVRLWYRQPVPDDGSAPLREVFHKHPDTSTPPAERKPNITRCNELVDYVVTRSVPGSDAVETLRGGAFLGEDIEAPYRFIVTITRSRQDIESDRIVKMVHAILGAEKPAHTQYHLRLMTVSRESRRRFMQVGVRSSIGADTLLS